MEGSRNTLRPALRPLSENGRDVPGPECYARGGELGGDGGPPAQPARRTARRWTGARHCCTPTPSRLPARGLNSLWVPTVHLARPRDSPRKPCSPNGRGLDCYCGCNSPSQMRWLQTTQRHSLPVLRVQHGPRWVEVKVRAGLAPPGVLGEDPSCSRSSWGSSTPGLVAASPLFLFSLQIPPCFRGHTWLHWTHPDNPG